MTPEKRIANLFKLDDKAWMKHSNPWSVYTRFSVLVLLYASIWARTWLGWWSLLLVAIVIIWTFVNPHLFPKPKSTKNWFSKSVLGERVYINRDVHPVSDKHKYMPNITNLIGMIGLGLSIYGLIYYHLAYIILGYFITVIGKMWYLDRMVWIYEEMKHIPEYAKWEY